MQTQFDSNGADMVEGHTETNGREPAMGDGASAGNSSKNLLNDDGGNGRGNGFPGVNLDDSSLSDLILHYMNEGVFLYEAGEFDQPGTRIVKVNPAFERMTGYTQAELMNQSPRILHGEKTDPAIPLRIRAAQKAAEPIKTELIYYRKDGSELAVQLQIVPMKGSDGNGARFIAIHRDITEQWRMNQPDEEHRNELWERMLRLVPLPVSITQIYLNDIAHNRFVTRQFAEIFGLTLEEASRDFRNIAARVHPDDVPEMTQNSIRCNTPHAEMPWRHEYRVIHPERGIIWVESHNFPDPQPDGSNIWYGITNDITERKKFEEERRQEQERFRMMLEKSPGAMCSFQIQADGAFQLLYASERFYEMHGVIEAERETLFADAYRYVPHEDMALAHSACCEATATLNLARAEYRIHRPQSDEIWVESRYVPEARPDGSIIWYGIAIDITARKRLEQEIRDSQNRLEMIIDAANVGLYDMDIRSKSMNWVRNLESLYGLPEGIFGLTTSSYRTGYQTLRERIHPDDIGSYETIFKKARENNSKFEHTYRVILPDNSIRHLTEVGQFEIDSANGSESGNGNGSESGSWRMKGIVIDVSRQQEMAKLIRENERHLTVAIDAAQLGIWDWDMTTNHTVWYGKHESLMGFQPGEFTGGFSQFSQRIHQEDILQLEAALTRDRKKRREHEHTFRVLFPNGKYRWITAKGKFFYNEEGEAIRMAGAFYDVTHQKDLEAERHRLENIARRRSVTLSAARQVAMDILMERVGNPALEHIAEAARNLTGARYSALGVVDQAGQGFQEFIPIGFTPKQTEILVAVSAQQSVLRPSVSLLKPMRIDHVSEHPEFRRFPLVDVETESLLFVPIKRDDDVLGYLYLINLADQPPFTEMEEAAVVALADYAALAIHFQQMLADQSAVTHRFINTLEDERRSVAYDLHDGLTQYVMASQAFLDSHVALYGETTHEPLPETLIRAKRYLHDAVVEARRMVNGLRSLALDDLGLIGALSQLIFEEERHAGWDESDFQYDLPDERLDNDVETAIYRVTQEALTNARKHSETPRVQVILMMHRNEPSGNDTIKLVIRDWGIGFNPVDRQDQQRHVGLQSMGERVRLMKGEYKLKSAPGEGTLIEAYFPAIMAQATTKS